MKAQISRISFRREERYSGVYQIQGGLVTDSDLGEQTEISRLRTDSLGSDAIADGVPAEGGALTIADGLPALRPGVVYADGVRGVLAFRPQASVEVSPANLLSAYEAQEDYQQPPDVPDGQYLVYLDIWERPVFDLEDPFLTDPGLGGNETSARTRTMTQIKLAPLEAAVLDDPRRFPRVGSGELSAEFTPDGAVADDCDPCAAEVTERTRMHNMLVRLEIVHVPGKPDAPGAMEIAWSISNAADRQTGDGAFDASSAPVFEYYSTETERQQGVFPDPGKRVRSAFSEQFPRPTDLASGQELPFTRTWTGWAKVDPGRPGPVSNANRMGAGSVSVESGVVEIVVGEPDIRLRLDMKDKLAVAGDYWLVVLRGAAVEEDQIRVLSPTPIGIEHHYCGLFPVTINGTTATPSALDDATRRKLSFPSLMDLPADHVGFVDPCETSTIFKDDAGVSARNVQEALARLCNLHARSIAFDNDCERLFDNATTVQEALSNLCSVDLGADRLLRLLFDWGVVCGLRVVRPKGGRTLQVTDGVFLDHGGHLVSARVNDGKSVTVSEIEVKDAPGKRDATLCLAISADAAGEVALHLISETRARKFVQPSMRELAEACEKRRAILDIDITERTKAVKVRLQGAYKAGAAGLAGKLPIKLTADDEVSYDRHIEKVVKAIVDDTEADRKETVEAELRKVVADTKAATPLTGISGEARELLIGKRAADQAAALVDWIGRDVQQSCECIHVHLPCPKDAGARPWYVPIARLDCRLDANLEKVLSVSRVCEWACRKVAVTPRGARYWEIDGFNRVQSIGVECCQTDPVGPPVFPPTLPFPPESPIPFPQPWPWIRWTDRLIIKDIPDSRLPVDPRTKVDGLPIDAAKSLITEKGGLIKEVIDVDEEGAFDAFAEKAGDYSTAGAAFVGDTILPGDGLTLLVQNGEARGYVIRERGGAIARGTGMDVAGITEELKVLGRQKTELATSLEGLKAGVGDLSNIKADLEVIGNQRAAIASDVTALKSELQDASGIRDQIEGLKAERSALENSLAGLKNETNALRADRDALEASLRDLEIDDAGSRVGVLATRIESLRALRDDLQTSVSNLKIDEASARVEGLKTEVARLEGMRNDLRRSIEELGATKERLDLEIATSRRNAEDAFREIRGRQPVGTVVGIDPNVAAGLNSINVTDVRTLADSQPADLSGAGLSATAARRAIVNAKRMLGEN